MVQSLGLSSATRFFCADRLNSPGNPHLKPEEQFGGFVNAVSQFGESAGHALVAAAYALHIGGGFAGLVSGFVAVFAPKGGRLHRVAGTVFVAAMTVMAAFALVISLVLPDPVNLVISVFAFYLIFTAWLTVRRRNGRIGLAEKGALVLCLILLAPFATLSFQLMTGLKPFLTSSVALKGPIVIAITGFAVVLAIAAIGDIKTMFAGGISGAPRIARHLWRMCLGLTLATGSAFTNGFARLLPGPYHVPAAFFLPQFVPLLLLFFWMIRVRMTGWYRANPAANNVDNGGLLPLA